MRLSYRIENQICILSIEGDLSQKKVIKTRDYIQNLLEDEPVEGLIINLRKISDIDSYGLGTIVTVSKISEQYHTEFALCELNATIWEVFSISQLDSFIRVYATEKEALEALTEIR